MKSARIVNHRDGTKSLKHDGKVAKLSAPKTRREVSSPPMEFRENREGTFLARRPTNAKITLPTVSMQAAPPPPAPKTTSAAKNARKVAAAPPAPITARPKEFHDRTHHESHPGGHVVTTTNAVPKILRRAKARTGSHVESFQRDYELAGSDLKSPNLGGVSGGGSGDAVPLQKIQAIDRLLELERLYPRAFKICEAVLIYGAQPTSIHKLGGPQHALVTRQIQDAIEDLANFYTPAKKRPDKALAAWMKFVSDAKRAQEAIRV